MKRMPNISAIIIWLSALEIHSQQPEGIPLMHRRGLFYPLKGVYYREPLPGPLMLFAEVVDVKEYCSAACFWGYKTESLFIIPLCDCAWF